MQQLPPEIWIDILLAHHSASSSDSSTYLPRLRLVCTSWNNIVLTTPGLWGNITVHKRSDPRRLETQIAMAHSSPLSISVHDPKLRHDKALTMLIDLAKNWVHADVETPFLERCTRSHLDCNLESLKLTVGINGPNTNTPFWSKEDTVYFPRLRSFTLINMPGPWCLYFLSPFLTDFEFHPNPSCIVSHHLSETLTYLSKIPNAQDIKLREVHHRTYDLPTGSASTSPIHLSKLTTLELSGVLNPSTLLHEIKAPALRTLIIHERPELHPVFQTPFLRLDLETLSPTFIQWSQPGFVPSGLHTLVLEDCLCVDDIPSLIRWLAYIPSLVNLTLGDDAVTNAMELTSNHGETDIIKAFSSPTESGGWLCVSLACLRISADIPVEKLLPLARARGGRCTPEPMALNPPPTGLRCIEASLCPNGSSTEIQLLKELVDKVVCGCPDCQLKFAVG